MVQEKKKQLGFGHKKLAMLTQRVLALGNLGRGELKSRKLNREGDRGAFSEGLQFMSSL